MKRTRTVSSVSKPQKKCRDGASKAAAAAAAKVKKEDVDQEKRAAPSPATVEAAAPAAAPAEEVQCLWDVAGECGWWWGVEEDVLFGWFPFEEEDFLFSENRGSGGSGGAFWEDYHDIWQLQHIHEIPSSSANNS